MWCFLGIGAQKAGTSWLHAMLSRHPAIGFPAGKELHFWNRPHDAAAVAAYRAQFAASARCEGEITPAYALLDVATIRAIRDAVPELRLLFVLRNPMERAWSSALMALHRAELEIDEAGDPWFIDHFRSRGSLGRGDYETTIRRWRSVFPSRQLLILRYEEIRADPAALLDRCFRHLGVAAVPPGTLETWGIREAVFAGAGHPVRPSLRPLLRSLYRDRIMSLAAYLQMDLSDWLEW